MAEGVAGNAEGSSVGVGDEDGSGRRNLSGDVEIDREVDGGDTVALENSSDQAAGPIAQGSGGDQQGEID